MLRYNIERNLLVLFFVRIASSMSMAVMFSSLALYLNTTIKLDGKLSAEIIGTFLALSYILPLLGGYLGNNYINFKKLYCVGMTIQALGVLLLAFVGSHLVSVALAMFLVGSMVGSVSIFVFISEIVGDDDYYRRRAMLWNYCAMNIGFISGYIFSGAMALHHSYKMLFLILSGFPILAVLLVGSLLHYQKKPNRKRDVNRWGLVISSIILVAVLHYVIAYASTIRIYILLLSSLGFLYLLFSQFSVNREKRIGMWTLAFYMVVAALFWSVYMLTPTFLMIFMRDHVNMLVYGKQITPQWLVNVNPIILIIGPVLLAWFVNKLKKRKKLELPTAFFFFAGVLCTAIGALILSHVITQTPATIKIPVLYIIIYLAFIGLAELFIGPEGVGLPGKLAPRRLKGVMTGAWISMLGVGSVVSTFISDAMFGSDHRAPLIASGEILHHIAVGMFLLAAFTLFAGLWFDSRFKRSLRLRASLD